MNDIEKIKAALALARRFAKAPEAKEEFHRLANASWCITSLHRSGSQQRAMSDLEHIEAALMQARRMVPKGKKHIDAAIAAAQRLTVIAQRHSFS
jgi:hypothetical protein